MEDQLNILNILDEQFDKMNRPVFEYNELDYISSKCSIMKLQNNGWLICIQTLFNDEEGPFLSLDMYGNILKNKYHNVNINLDIKNITEQEPYLTQALRELVQDEEFKKGIWLSPDGVLKELNIALNIVDYYETEEWEYPDYLSLPSDSPSFHYFAQFLTSTNEKMDLGTPNTHWIHWHEYDIDQ